MPPEETSSNGEVRPRLEAPRRSAGRLLLSGGLWSIFGRFGQSVVMVLGTMVLARLLTPEDFGTVVIASVLLMLSFAFLEGFVEFPILRVAELDPARLASLVALGLVAAAVMALLLVLLAPVVGGLMAFDGLEPVLQVVAPVMLFQAVAVAGRALLRRAHRFRTVSGVLIAAAAAYVGIGIGMALAGAGYWSLVGGQIASYVAMSIGFAGMSGLRPMWPRPFGLGDMAGTAMYGSVSRVLGWAWTQIDTLAVGMTSTAAQTGIYSRAYNLSTQVKEPFAALDHPIRQVLISVRNEGGNLSEATSRALRLLVIASSLVCALIIALRQEAILIILGPKWSEAVLPFAILVAGLPARVARQFIDSVTIVSGSMRRMVSRHLTFLCVIGIGVLVAASYGILAVAIVVTLAVYLVLLLPARHDPGQEDVDIPLLKVMLPGLAIGLVFVGSSEVFDLVAAPSPMVRVIAVLGAFVATLAAVAIASPAHWFSAGLVVRRNRILSRLAGRRV